MVCMITVVVPVYNSAAILPELCHRLITELGRLSPDYEIILVDDGSGDKSFEIMCLLHEKEPRIKIIRLAGNYGQQSAVVCGLRHARGRAVITMDDDLQHPPEEIRHLLKTLDEGYDLVFGISRAKRHSFYRSLGSYLTDRIFNIIKLKVRDIRISSFRAVRLDTARRAFAQTPGFAYVSAQLLLYAQHVASIPVTYQARHSGDSNYNFLKLMRLFLRLILYYSPLFVKITPKGGELYVIKEKHL